MKNLDLFSQRVIVFAVAIAIVLLSASLFVLSLSTISTSFAQEIIKEEDVKKRAEEKDKKPELTAMNTSQLSVAGTGDGGFVICVGIYEDTVYYILNGKLFKVSLKKDEIIK